MTFQLGPRDLPQYTTAEPVVFGGDKATSWASGALQKAFRLAEDMLRKGEPDPQKIFSNTGLWKGAEGKWRFEIPDTDARLNYEWSPSPADPHGDVLRDVLDHPALYEAYPNLKSTKVIALDDPTYNFGGDYASMRHNSRGLTQQQRLAMDPLHYDPRDTIHINMAKYLPSDEAGILSVLLHEVQHGIQARNDFAFGGAPEGFEKWNKETLNMARDENYSALLKRYSEENPIGDVGVKAWWDSLPEDHSNRGRWDDFRAYLDQIAPFLGRGDDPFTEWEGLFAENKSIGERAKGALDMMKQFSPHEQWSGRSAGAHPIPFDAERMYLNTAGEREARNVQLRKRENRYSEDPTSTEGRPRLTERAAFTRDGIWRGLGTTWDNIISLYDHVSPIPYHELPTLNKP